MSNGNREKKKPKSGKGKLKIVPLSSPFGSASNAGKAARKRKQEQAARAMPGFVMAGGQRRALHGAAKSPAPEDRLIYRGYELEQKTLMVGWQITITKDGTFVRNGSVTTKLDAAMDDAHAYIDGLFAQAASRPVRS